ncbi:DUF1013 domain-containing protein [bacterium]|nr:DUF1013 domain-containing protein [bacterium]
MASTQKKAPVLNTPLMPKATAVWLVENTGLSFDQIAEFCSMHPLEVQGIADGEVAQGIIGMDQIANGQLTRENIEACEKDPKKKLEMAKGAVEYLQLKTKGTRYTPVARRRDKPDAIAWLIKNYPAITDGAIIKLIGTTKSTIAAIRDRSHWNMSSIKPRDPVLLGLCTQIDLDKTVARLRLEPAVSVDQQTSEE